MARLLLITASVIWTGFVSLLAPMMQFVLQKRLRELSRENRALHNSEIILLVARDIRTRDLGTVTTGEVLKGLVNYGGTVA